MKRPANCYCNCDPPDCLGCSPTWRDNPALPLKAVFDWTPPTWSMPSTSESVIPDISLYRPLCEAGQAFWNCGTWTPPPVYCGCGTPTLTGTLTTRWYDGPTGDIASGQDLHLSPTRCSWTAGKPRWLNQYSHNGYIARSAPSSSATTSGPAEWNEEVLESVNLASVDEPPIWADPGTDTFASLQTTVVRVLYSLNNARPGDHGDLGWVRNRVSFGWGISLSSGKDASGDFRWSVQASLGGIRTWMFNSILSGGTYAGRDAGSSYGANLNVENYGAVSASFGSKRSFGHSLDWMNQPFSVHPTYELVNRIDGSPGGNPPGVGYSLGGAYLALPTNALVSYISDEPVNCEVDFQDGLPIAMSIAPGQEAKLAVYSSVFGLSAPESFSFTFLPVLVEAP